MICIKNRKYKQLIILAGGKGTRMKYEGPKCGYVIEGKSMIERIMCTCQRIKFNKRIVVLGYKKEELERILYKSKYKRKYKIAYQEKQLGTADAVKSTKHLANKEGITIIIPGDMPFIDDDIINSLINFHLKTNSNITILTNIVSNPYGYGRIIKENNLVLRIVEEVNAKYNEKEVNEVNSGVLCINSDILYTLIDMVGKNNKNDEYYLTDIVEIANNTLLNPKITTVAYDNDYRLLGVNNEQVLSNLSNRLN